MIKKQIKHVVLSTVKRSGYWRYLKKRCRSRLVSFCYHGVMGNNAPANSRSNIAVTVGAFERQLQLIRQFGTPVSLADIEAHCLDQKPLPEYAVCVTFDDGYRNNLSLAAPLLKKYEIPAVVFVTTGYIGHPMLIWPQEIRERIIEGAGDTVFIPKNNAIEEIPVPMSIIERERLAARVVCECKKMPKNEFDLYWKKLQSNTTLNCGTAWKREIYDFMNWDEIREIRKYGVEIGAHTVTHPILASLSPEKQREELSESKKKIEAEIGPCTAIAYPNGGKNDFNDEVIEMAASLGYKIGFNLCEQRNDVELNPMSIDRFCVTLDISALEFERMLLRN